MTQKYFSYKRDYSPNLCSFQSIERSYFRKGWERISSGESLLFGLKSSIPYNKSINYSFLSSPKVSYFFNDYSIFLNKVYYFIKIFLPSLPWTPNNPIPIIFFPLGKETLPFKDNHNGNPLIISSKIAPKDHTS